MTYPTFLSQRRTPYSAIESFNLPFFASSFHFSLLFPVFISNSHNVIVHYKFALQENLFCKKIKQTRCEISSLISWHTNASFSQHSRWTIFYKKVLSLLQIYHGSFPMISKWNHIRYCVNFFTVVNVYERFIMYK